MNLKDLLKEYSEEEIRAALKAYKKRNGYFVTYEQIENYRREGYEKGKAESIRQAAAYSMAVPMIVLRDNFDFGAIRLKRFYDGFIDIYDSIDRGYLDIKDITKTLEEEVGIQVLL